MKANKAAPWGWLVIGLVGVLAIAGVKQYIDNVSIGKDTPQVPDTRRTWNGPWQWQTNWQSVSSGLSWSSLIRQASDGTVRVVAMRADTDHWQVRVVDMHHHTANRGANADDVLSSSGAVINAGFFNPVDLTPIGLVITDSELISPRYDGPCMYGAWGVLAVRQRHPIITSLWSSVPAGVTQAMQCAPVLVQKGLIPDLNDCPPATRAAVGLDTHDRIIFAVMEGTLTLNDWAICLHKQLGCHDALNLDGGPSAQLTIRGTTPVIALPGTKVPIFLQLVPQ